MLTTIQVRSETRDRLKSIGRKGESYDAVIRRLLEENEGRTPLSSPA
jgi:predicted CopG family antitoxin